MTFQIKIAEMKGNQFTNGSQSTITHINKPCYVEGSINITSSCMSLFHFSCQAFSLLMTSTYCEDEPF